VLKNTSGEKMRKMLTSTVAGFPKQERASIDFGLSNNLAFGERWILDLIDD